MPNWFKKLLVFSVVGLVQFSSLDAEAARKDPEIGTRGQSAEARAKAMAALSARLSASPRAAARHTITLSGNEKEILANPSVDSTGRFRVGVHRSVGRSVSKKDADLIVSIPGAQGIRLELSQVKGTVAVFNELGQAYEYTEDGFTHTFSGEEVRVRGSARVSGAGAVNLGGNLCTGNASCVENAECAGDMPSNIAALRNAYASILYQSGGGYYVCTGGLLADSDPSTEKPYFLTANHCISTASEASSVATHFQYVRETCSAGSCSYSLSDWSDTVGATIRATNSTGDFTLLELSGTPPAGSVYLGWNSSDNVANTNGAELYRISHPGGYPQAYSEHQVDTGSVTCGSLPRGSYIYSRDTFGATEGGSSGSPVLNATGQVVGQLFGACGFNTGNVCDSGSNATVDGAFTAYYPQVQPFLGNGTPQCSANSDCDDGNACTTDSCDGGICNNTAVSCDDGNACTTDICDPGTGACTQQPVVCDDGNLCTNDSCDSVTGCINTPKCTDPDACTASSCDPTTGNCNLNQISCDDGINCTEDSCDIGTGCINDDSACSAGPVCGNGICEAGEDCGSCANDCRARTRGGAKSRYCCDGDLTDCGDSRCSESPWQCGGETPGCLTDAECNDGQFCNGVETCNGGVCQSGNEPCSGQSCNESSDTCEAPPPPGCGGNKETCSVNGDCCSGSCRGGRCRGN